MKGHILALVRLEFARAGRALWQPLAAGAVFLVASVVLDGALARRALFFGTCIVTMTTGMVGMLAMRDKYERTMGLLRRLPVSGEQVAAAKFVVAAAWALPGALVSPPLVSLLVLDEPVFAPLLSVAAWVVLSLGNWLTIAMAMRFDARNAGTVLVSIFAAVAGVGFIVERIGLSEAAISRWAAGGGLSLVGLGLTGIASITVLFIGIAGLSFHLAAAGFDGYDPRRR